MTDPISDMFTSLRNAQLVLKESVEIPFSQLKLNIAKILEREGYVKVVEQKGRRAKKIIEIVLKYDNKLPAISYIERVSKPGKRIYERSAKLSRMRRGGGIVIVSTSKGVLSDREAKKLGLGGEVLGRVS